MKSTRETLELLRSYESRNVTYIAPDGSWPIVWERARGVYVWDIEGRKYLDLTAAFGVAVGGHAQPNVVAAGRKQMGRLLHAMGDVHPHRLKAELARELSRVTFERWSASGARVSPGRLPALTGKTIFCNSGFEAVEAALKTAVLTTGKPGVIAFKGAYHGLGYGALNATHRDHFRGPFRAQLRGFGEWLPFPIATPEDGSTPGGGGLAAVELGIRALCRRKRIGAVLAEPIQARGGINVPPAGFLPLLRRLCDEEGMLLILDEIYTGFGRTGRWFACEHSGTVPDLICLGKALTGGFPLSACVGRTGTMDQAWPVSTGEAIHTSTFLGHPVGCAMALENLHQIAVRQLVERSRDTGALLNATLKGLAEQLNRQYEGKVRATARGVGCLAGLALARSDGTAATQLSLDCLTQMLRKGFILLPEGENANVISFTPPLMITRSQLLSSTHALLTVLSGLIAA